MSELVPSVPAANASKIDAKDNRPKIGEYFWVKCDDGEERLMSVYHIASNHVEFYKASYGGGYWCENIRYRDLMKVTRPELNFRAVLDQQIAEKRLELAAAVRALADAVKGADLIPEQNVEPTLLPSTTRFSPESAKKSLIRLRDKKLPKLQKNIEEITQAITLLHRDQCLPMIAETARMKKATAGIENRLFALELYAGLWQKIKQIGQGKAAPEETPIAVRQMIRYMDEETLFDWDQGGMDFEKLGDFDKWIAKPENYGRILPEPRCIVAFQIRRNPKDYGHPLSIADAFRMLENHQANMKTYLVMRNGENVFRLWTEIEFKPRLLPMREEFIEHFTKEEHKSNFGDVPFGESKSWTETKSIGPDDLDYDDHVESMKEKLFNYNRIMFLVQGLLDRSKVFAPHPPINLADQDHILRYFRGVFDEQDGLPSSDPPDWKKYRDAGNALIRPGTYVYCDEVEPSRTIYNRFGHWDKRPHQTERPRICKVHSVSRDKQKITFRWEVGDRIEEKWILDETRPVPNKPGWYYRKKLEINHGTRFGLQTCDVENCFNVEYYKPGEYKKFLCDAYLKGRYLEWAPELLSAEKWHRERNIPKKESDK